MTFVKAQRRRVFLKMAVTGPSGSGKTYSALRLAFGLAGDGGRVAVLDTENGSASLYADLGDYDVMTIDAPFTAQKYIDAIREACQGGYDVLVIDSLSHVWAGDGGLLDQKSARDGRGGNQFTNWAEISKIYEQFKSHLLQSPVHVIGTMRSKQDYVIEQGQGGKQTPRKVGMAPIQREGMEYEFTLVLDVDMSHTAATSKDRTGLFTDEISQITEGHGTRLRTWLAGGAAPAQAAPKATFQPPAEARQAAEVPPRSRASDPARIPHGANNGSGPNCVECGKMLNKAQQELSVRHYGEPLCPTHQQSRKSRGPAESQTPARTSPVASQASTEDDPFEDVYDEGLAVR